MKGNRGPTKIILTGDRIVDTVDFQATSVILGPVGQVTNTNLIISFNIPDGSGGWPGGRTSSVTGAWTFTFTK